MLEAMSSAPTRRPPHQPPPLASRVPASGLRVLVAVMLVALNLRIAVTSLGALLDRLDAAGVGATTQAVLTSLPVLCFAVVGGAAIALTRRYGTDRALLVALVVLTLGLALRPLDGTPVLVAGTAVACAGIALANVLVPAVVKERFPDRVGPVTGAYTAALSVGSAAGAALTVPLADVTGGWRPGLGLWAIIGLVALVAWLPHARAGSADDDAERGEPLWRDPTAWAITVLFATQSLFAYVMMSWLPSVYADAGSSAQHAGVLLAVSIIAGIPAFFVAPIIAGRLRHQGHLIAGLTALTGLGWAGLALAPAGGAWLWAVLLGVGGAVFPVVLTMFGLRTSTAADTATLSAMAQGTGYLLAAGGPFAVGVLHDATGGWGLPCSLLVGLAAVQIAAGYRAGRPVQVRSQTRLAKQRESGASL